MPRPKHYGSYPTIYAELIDKFRHSLNDLTFTFPDYYTALNLRTTFHAYIRALRQGALIPKIANETRERLRDQADLGSSRTIIIRSASQPYLRDSEIPRLNHPVHLIFRDRGNNAPEKLLAEQLHAMPTGPAPDVPPPQTFETSLQSFLHATDNMGLFNPYEQAQKEPLSPLGEFLGGPVGPAGAADEKT